MSYSLCSFVFFFSSRRRHTRFDCDWSSDVCSSDLGAEQVAEHGGIDGMADEVIRSRGDELVIGAETSIDSPLTAESAGAGPGKKTGEDEKDNGERDLPGPRKSFPEMALPQK